MDDKLMQNEKMMEISQKLVAVILESLVVQNEKEYIEKVRNLARELITLMQK